MRSATGLTRQLDPEGAGGKPLVFRNSKLGALEGRRLHWSAGDRVVNARFWIHKGTSPARCGGLLVSHGTLLYLFGGVGTYSQDETLIMSCSAVTGIWQSVHCQSEPSDKLRNECTGRLLSLWSLA